MRASCGFRLCMLCLTLLHWILLAHIVTAIDHTPFDARGFLAAASRLVSRAASAEAQKDRLCIQSYSARYISRWANIKDDLCLRHDQQKLASQVLCAIHPDVDLTTCSLHNLWINSSSFLGSSPRHNALPAPASGSLLATCQLQPPASILRGRLLHEGTSLIFNNTLQPTTAASTPCKPDSTLPGAVMFLTRRDPVNPFHVLEQLVSMFAGFAALQLAGVSTSSRRQVVVLDDHRQGPYWPVLDRISAPYPTRQLRTAPFPPSACLGHVMLAPWVGDMQSLLTQNGGTATAVSCPSEVLVAASLWLRWLFRDVEEGQYQATQPGAHQQPQQQQQQSATLATQQAAADSNPAPAKLYPGRGKHRRAGEPLQLRVLWLSRGSQQAGGKGPAPQLTPWQAARVLGNEAAVVGALQGVVDRWNRRMLCGRRQQQDSSCRPAVEYQLQAVELGRLPFYPDQLQLLFSAGVLVGVHGAALTNQIWLPPAGGALVELWHGMSDNYHYQNMADMLLHVYKNVQTPQQQGQQVPQDANITAVAEAVLEAMQQVALRRSRGRRRKGFLGWQ